MGWLQRSVVLAAMSDTELSDREADLRKQLGLKVAGGSLQSEGRDPVVDELLGVMVELELRKFEQSDDKLLESIRDGDYGVEKS